MIILNPWVGYLDRSYQQIKTRLLNRLRVSNPEITDYSESNPLIIIVDMFSGLVEILNVYVDDLAREAYLESVRRFSNLLKLVTILDYRIKLANPAGVLLKFTFDDGSGNPDPATAAALIPAGTRVKTENGVEFVTSRDSLVAIGDTQAEIPAFQYTTTVGSNIGTTNGTASQQILVGAKVVHGSVSLMINSELWTQRKTFAYSGPSSKDFIVDLKADGLAYIIFGDGVFGKIPTSGYPILATLKISEGSDANLITIGAINTLISTITIPGVVEVKVTNENNPMGAQVMRILN